MYVREANSCNVGMLMVVFNALIDSMKKYEWNIWNTKWVGWFEWINVISIEMAVLSIPLVVESLKIPIKSWKFWFLLF